MRITADDLRAAKWRGTELNLNPMGKWEAGVHYEDAWAGLADDINCRVEARRTYADEIAEIVRVYVAGPNLAAAGKTITAITPLEESAVQQWRNDLVRRVGIALHRGDQTSDGYSIALSIQNSLLLDRLVEQPASLLKEYLR